MAAPITPKLIRMNEANNVDLYQYGFVQSLETFLMSFKQMNESYLDMIKDDEIDMWNKAGVQALIQHINLSNKRLKNKEKHLNLVYKNDVTKYCLNTIPVAAKARRIMTNYVKTSLTIQATLVSLLNKHFWVTDRIVSEVEGTHEEKEAHINNILKAMITPIYVDLPTKLPEANKAIDALIDALHKGMHDITNKTHKPIQITELNKMNDNLEEQLEPAISVEFENVSESQRSVSEFVNEWTTIIDNTTTSDSSSTD